MTATPGIQLLADLDAATTLGGTEIIYGEQGGEPVKITIAQIREGRATLTGIETLTNKTLTAPAINGGTLDGTQTITSQSGFRAALGLGNIATQAASAVAITGGTISGITDLAVADGGTGASNASGARTNLGLGTIATQASSSVALTGGAIDGVTIGATTAAAIKGTTINATSAFQQNGTQVVGARDTGWTAMTGTPDKSTSYATGSVTLAQLAGRVMALQTALTTHGLIGT
jgi:hypothetical protein